MFRGLADPTRRAVLERLSRGPTPVTELAQPFDMALPSFTQHLNILEGCGLVKSTKTGRVRTYTLVPASLSRADAWLNRQQARWTSRLDQLDALLLQMKDRSKS
ncbi:MAG: winged helix-turn-helix transcriptional regulator [Acidobacteria bacterium]|nr:winged helix-turn-helix transcriptional regulator [Acidobacteriota bacterium]